MLFGLLCLQLGDVVAETGAHKARQPVPAQEEFPIPVVVNPAGIKRD